MNIENKNNSLTTNTVPNPVKACYVVSKENHEKIAELSKSSRKLLSASLLVNFAITRLLEDIQNNKISFIVNLSDFTSNDSCNES